MSRDYSTVTVSVAGFRCNCCPCFSQAASAASVLKKKICSNNSAHVNVKEFPTRECYESWVTENTNGSEWLDALVSSGGAAVVPCSIVSVNGEWGKSEPCHAASYC